MPRTRCLTATELTAFHLGDLPEAELAALGEHLEGCPRCDEAARALDGLSDPTLAAYRQSATSDPLPARKGLPERVGDYEILAEVGRGGMGVVYRARHVRLHRVVALKMLLGGHFADGDKRLRFRVEAEAVACLQHPHIVQLFESGEYEVDPGLPRPYFTLEFVEGGNLAQRLAGRLVPPRQAAAWLESLARAAHYAHERGIIHRDLKPSNILLTGDGQPKVCDFGVAKLAAGSDLKTLSGFLVGTAEYMAPEQAEGRAAVGPATDVYALGAILYELLTGRPPFKGTSTLDTINQVKVQEPVPPRRLQPHVPRDLETIAMKCLAKEPRRRFPTAAALAEDLGCFLAGKPITARPVGGWEQAVKWCRRRPALAALLTALVVVTLLGLAGVISQMLRADAARAVAVREKEVATAERTRAVQLADELRTQRDAAQWQTYRAHIAAAVSALRLHNASSARQYLKAAPAKHRNWEWRHLDSQLDGARAVLRGNGLKDRSVAFSRDGRRLSSSDDYTLRLWDPATLQEVAVLRGHTARVNGVAFSPATDHLASASDDGTLRLWDAVTGRPTAVLRPTGRLTGPFWAPDGRHVAVNSAATFTVWDVRTRQQVAAFPGGQQFVTGAFRPGGRQFARGSGSAVQVWDLDAGRDILTLHGQDGLVLGLAYSPDGRRLAAGFGYPDSAVRLWDATSGRLIAVRKGHLNGVGRVTFSPDGTRLASCSPDQTVRLWDGATGRAVAVLRGHTDRVRDGVFSPASKRFLSASDDQTLRLWDAATGELIAVLRGHQGPIADLAVSPDGRTIASASEDHTVRLWDAELAQRSGVLRGHGRFVYDVAFRPDGGQVASAAWDGTVRLWDPTTGRQTGLLPHEGDGIVGAVAFHPDGRQLVTVCRDRKITLWDLATGKPRRVIQAPTGGWTGDARAAFNPAGTLLAVGSADGRLRLFDPASGEPVATLAGHHNGQGEQAENARDVAFSPDGRLLASAGYDKTVRLWDVATRKEHQVFTGHTAEVYAVCFRGDGRWLASGGYDGTARIWDVAAHQELAVLPHRGKVLCVAFSPDGTRLATGCADNTIRLWDLATFQEVAELHGHTAYVHALAWSPDGTRLVSGSGDGTARVWDTLPARARARARKSD
jgi:WD40 repeat protein